VEFRISEDQVCLKNNITKLSSGDTNYILMNKLKENCEVDYRFALINYLDELKYF